MIPEATFQEATLAALQVDITTLDESCGLQTAPPYYTRGINDLAP